MKFYLATIGIALFLFDLALTQEVPHKNLHFECDQCHSVNNWTDIHFDHEKARYTLESAHQNLYCKQCHNIVDFEMVHKECIGCHLDVHQGKLGPVCNLCHQPIKWFMFDLNQIHANTTFPVLGAHTRLDCDACHFSEIEGRFSIIQSDCFSCHEADYRNTKNPVHDDIGFGQRCSDCHTLFTWKPAVFINHEPFFPISSGAHAGVWESCGTCHVQSGNLQVFSCFLNCHAHNKGSMDAVHREEVSNYVYESSACYQCHPRGRGEERNN